MNKTVLVCDDSKFMRTLIGSALKQKGYTIICEASDGNEAVERYKELKPDLVTMDVTMPTSGILAVEHIMKYDNNATIIMCSAMGQKIFIMESLHAGAKDFIIKPFTQQQLVDVVEKHI